MTLSSPRLEKILCGPNAKPSTHISSIILLALLVSESLKKSSRVLDLVKFFYHRYSQILSLYRTLKDVLTGCFNYIIGDMRQCFDPVYLYIQSTGWLSSMTWKSLKKHFVKMLSQEDQMSKSSQWQLLRKVSLYVQAIYFNSSTKPLPGLSFNYGRAWSEQRRFTLKVLKDFGFGKSSLEGSVKEECSRLIRYFK